MFPLVLVSWCYRIAVAVAPNTDTVHDKAYHIVVYPVSYGAFTEAPFTSTVLV